VQVGCSATSGACNPPSRRVDQDPGDRRASPSPESPRSPRAWTGPWRPFGPAARRPPLKTFVWMDALVLKCRGRGRIDNVTCVIATGVNADGHRESGPRGATAEDGAGWTAFLRSLGGAGPFPGAAGDLQRPRGPGWAKRAIGSVLPARAGSGAGARSRATSWPRFRSRPPVPGHDGPLDLRPA
jgi:mutator family transposase